MRAACCEFFCFTGLGFSGYHGGNSVVSSTGWDFVCVGTCLSDLCEVLVSEKDGYVMPDMGGQRRDALQGVLTFIRQLALSLEEASGDVNGFDRVTFWWTVRDLDGAVTSALNVLRTRGWFSSRCPALEQWQCLEDVLGNVARYFTGLAGRSRVDCRARVL